MRHAERTGVQRQKSDVNSRLSVTKCRSDASRASKLMRLAIDCPNASRQGRNHLGLFVDRFVECSDDFRRWMIGASHAAFMHKHSQKFHLKSKN
jgi:hypothetical protein